MRDRLQEIAAEVLEAEGYVIERIHGSGKASLRRLRKGATSTVVSIRTDQDTYIAFPRTKDDKGWVTLGMIDAVVAVSVDDRENPRFALVHMIDGDEMRPV